MKLIAVASCPRRLRRPDAQQSYMKSILLVTLEPPASPSLDRPGRPAQHDGGASNTLVGGAAPVSLAAFLCVTIRLPMAGSGRIQDSARGNKPARLTTGLKLPATSPAGWLR